MIKVTNSVVGVSVPGLAENDGAEDDQDVLVGQGNVNPKDQLAGAVLNPRVVVSDDRPHDAEQTLCAYANEMCKAVHESDDPDTGDTLKEHARRISGSFDFGNLVFGSLTLTSSFIDDIGKIVNIASDHGLETPKLLAERVCDLFAKGQFGKFTAWNVQYLIKLVLHSNGPIDEDKIWKASEAIHDKFGFDVLANFVLTAVHSVPVRYSHVIANITHLVGYLSKVSATSSFNCSFSGSCNLDTVRKIVEVATKFGLKIPKSLVEKAYDAFVNLRSGSGGIDNVNYVTMLFLCSDAPIDERQASKVFTKIYNECDAEFRNYVTSVVCSMPICEHVIANVPSLIDCLFQVTGSDAIVVDVASSAFGRLITGTLPLNTFMNYIVEFFLEKLGSDSIIAIWGICSMVDGYAYERFTLSEERCSEAQKVFSELVTQLLKNPETYAELLNSGLIADEDTESNRTAMFLMYILENLFKDSDDAGKVALKVDAHNPLFKGKSATICTLDAVPTMTYFVNIAIEVVALNGYNPRGHVKEGLERIIRVAFLIFPSLDDKSKWELIETIEPLYLLPFVKNVLTVDIQKLTIQNTKTPVIIEKLQEIFIKVNETEYSYLTQEEHVVFP
ncbi:MAG: hypothetical protein LBR91_00240 [Puniceicoccales bacterium]|nr:hypothetical protein [Puniceicoccales bacterium]